jgi:DNA-directed RNA polymerase subunit RPC12/RpoP
MTRARYDRCSRCGKPVWRHRTNRPEIVCLDCRAVLQLRQPGMVLARYCKGCGVLFAVPPKNRRQRCCSKSCASHVHQPPRSASGKFAAVAQ